MSGILVLWPQAGAPGASRDLRRAEQAMAKWAPVDSLIAGGADAGLVADVRLDNAPALRMELGLPQDATDHQVLQAAWVRWGREAPEHLAGDFAFACWDPTRRELFIARDHMGVRPLVYGRYGAGIAVATDVDGMLSLPGFDREPDPFSVAMLLANWWPDRTASWYRGARRLPGGHRATLRADGLVRVDMYWDLPKEELRLGSDAEYEARFRELFLEAVRTRVAGETNLGVEFSGGMDSSVVLGAVSQGAGSNVSIAAFSGSFADARWGGGKEDEGSYRTWADSLANVERIEIPAAEALGADVIDRLCRQHRVPIGGPMDLVRARVFERAADRGVSVVLDGVDGDATVNYGFERLLELLLHLRWWTLTREFVASWRRFGARGLRNSGVVLAYSSLYWTRWKRGAEAKLLRDTVIDRDFLLQSGLWDYMRDIALGAPGNVRGDHIGDILGGNESFVLENTARMAALAGLDARHPFFDRRLIEFAIQLPSDQFYRDGMPRWIHRKALEGLASDHILWRRDKGGIPASFITEIMAGLDIESLMASRGGLGSPYIEQDKLQEHYRAWKQKGSASASYALYMAAVLDRWLKSVPTVP